MFRKIAGASALILASAVCAQVPEGYMEIPTDDANTKIFVQSQSQLLFMYTAGADAEMTQGRQSAREIAELFKKEAHCDSAVVDGDEKTATVTGCNENNGQVSMNVLVMRNGSEFAVVASSQAMPEADYRMLLEHVGVSVKAR